MGRPADQEMTALEEIICYTHSSQEEGVYHSPRGQAGKPRGQLGGRGSEGEI